MAVASQAPGAYQDALSLLFARTGGTSRYGLDRVRGLLAQLGDPHLAVPVFHVAGTNGKGSTVATLEALLRARGLRVARFTSPHLVDFRERIVVDGRPIAEDAVVAFLRRWMPAAEQLGATFFEITTALAFDHFARAGVDVAVVETGLGGRLDSTNVVSPVVAGVTAIGLDHVELLGDTLERIAVEKAGIYKAGVPAVVGELDPAVRAVLVERARAAGAAPVREVAGECVVRDVRVGREGTSFTLDAPFGHARLVTPLLGGFQAHNVATALTMLDAAGARWRVTAAEAAPALAGVRLPGRFQWAGRYLFDVAHNPDGARVLAETLEAVRPARPVTAVFCALRDKEWEEMLTTLGRVVDSLVLTQAPTAPGSRAWDLDIVRGFVERAALRAAIEPDFERAIRPEASGTIVVTGSFHTVGDAMARLQVSPFAL